MQTSKLTKTTSTTCMLVICLFVAQLASFIRCQGVGGVLETATGFIPTVVVDNQKGDSSVDVHLNNLVNLSTDDINNLGSRVDLSVLGGLVTVNTNKTRLPNGQATGPVIVTVFGIPVYVGQGTSGKPMSLQPPSQPKIVKPQSNAEPISQKPIESRSQPKAKSPRVEKDKKLEIGATTTTVNKAEKADLSRIQLAEILTRMAQKINEQDAIIQELKLARAKSERAERSPMSVAEPIAPPVTFDQEAADSKLKLFEQVSDMLRNRRNNIIRDNTSS